VTEPATRIRPHFPWRIFSRVLLFQGLLILAGLAGSALVARHFFKRFFLEEVRTELSDAMRELKRTEPWRESPTGWCEQKDPEARLRYTYIAPDGRVLWDSQFNSKDMENHGGRAEVEQARREGTGFSVRHSQTIKQDLIYGATLLPGPQTIVRVALPLGILATALSAFDAYLALNLFLIALFLGGFAIFAARAVVAPFGRLLRSARALGQLDATEESAPEGRDEWTELEASIARIGRDLEATSERLKLERDELATLMEAISEAVLAVDADGVPLFFNSRFALLAPSSPVIRDGRRLPQILPQPGVKEVFEQVLATGQPASLDALEMEMGSGRRFFLLSVSPLRRRRSELVYGAVGLFHDVTELKIAERIRIDFVANVSHELRTPLTAIQGYSETLLMDAAAGRPAPAEFLTSIQRNSQRLLSLIDDLLNLSALEANVDGLEREHIPTGEFTTRVLSQLASKLQLKRQTMTVEVEAPTVFADPLRLEQVLINLVENANKFTPEGRALGVAWRPAPADFSRS